MSQLDAQVNVGSLSGSVTSTTGARVVTARLTAKNIANGDTKSISVAEDGSFTLTNLSPGVFEITISLPGFAEAQTTVTVKAGADGHADIVMHPEDSAGAAAGGASGVSGVVSTKSVTDLPLNGRSASDEDLRRQRRRA